MCPELLRNLVRGCFGSIDPCWSGGLLLPTAGWYWEGCAGSLCKFSDVSVSLSLSPPKVGPSWTDRWWQSRNTHDQLDDEGRGPARRDVFNVMHCHFLYMYIIYVSSSLDSLTLRSSVLGEERQVTVFAVRASRYPTQRGENTTFVFRLCKDLIQISKNTITDSCRCRLHRSF